MNYFNIRVYGIWIDDSQNVLVADERMGDFQFTKFPGGGLEFGEGIKDCLLREWKEELGIEIEIIRHFYTTDFFQISAFNKEFQIISIYYLVKPKDQFTNIPCKQIPFDFTNEGYEEEVFRFIPKANFSSNEFTLPIDKVVAGMIMQL